MAIENLVTEFGDKEFDGESVWRKGKKNYSVNDMEFKVDNLVQTAKGEDDNLFTVVFVAAVFIYD
jgi:hypothetical protein